MKTMPLAMLFAALALAAPAQFLQDLAPSDESSAEGTAAAESSPARRPRGKGSIGSGASSERTSAATRCASSTSAPTR